MLLDLEGFTGGIHSAAVITKAKMDPSECLSALNVEFWPHGTISKRQGYQAKHNVALSAKPSKIFDWADANGVYHTMVFSCQTGVSSGDIRSFTFSGSTASFSLILTAAVSGWAPVSTDVISCTTLGGSAIFVYGSSLPLFKWNGNNAEAATTVTNCPSGVYFVTQWRGFVFAANVLVGGIRSGSRVQWNTINNISDWPASNYIDLDADDGENISGMTVFNDTVVVFKPHKVFVLNWVGGVLMFQDTRRSARIGCIAGNSIVERDQMLFFLADTGIYMFDGVNTKELTQKIKDKIVAVETNYIKTSLAINYLEHDQIWFAVPSIGASANDTVFVLDITTGAWTVYNIPIQVASYITLSYDIIYASWPEPYSEHPEVIGQQVGIGSRVMAIGVANYICEFGRGSTDRGAAINAYWRSIWIDFGNPAMNKRIIRSTMLIERGTAVDTLTYSLYKDWDDTTVDKTFSVSMSASTVVNIIEKRVNYTRHLRAAQIYINATGSSDVFRVHKIQLDYLQKGRTLV